MGVAQEAARGAARDAAARGAAARGTAHVMGAAHATARNAARSSLLLRMTLCLVMVVCVAAESNANATIISSGFESFRGDTGDISSTGSADRSTGQPVWILVFSWINDILFSSIGFACVLATIMVISRGCQNCIWMLPFLGSMACLGIRFGFVACYEYESTTTNAIVQLLPCGLIALTGLILLAYACWPTRHGYGGIN